jgi:hypothetical protein
MVPNPSSPPVAYAADGRVAYTDSSRSQTLDGFLDEDPGGSWTLFFADRGAGNASTLNNWEVDLIVIPEPGNVALLCCFGALAATIKLISWRWKLGCAALGN